MLILFITVSYIISSYLLLIKDSPLHFENECFFGMEESVRGMKLRLGLGLSFCLCE